MDDKVHLRGPPVPLLTWISVVRDDLEAAASVARLMKGGISTPRVQRFKTTERDSRLYCGNH
jgi:hypothetical protein